MTITNHTGSTDPVAALPIVRFTVAASLHVVRATRYNENDNATMAPLTPSGGRGVADNAVVVAASPI